jgi:RecB family exonuclease
LTNGLDLEKRVPAGRVGANVIGTILHTFAERFLRSGGPADKILKEILDGYRLAPYTVRALYKQARLVAKFLSEDIENSRYKPKFFEHSLEKKIDGVTVRGKADRIDVDESKSPAGFVVVDYKSGGAGVVRLQLPLYMDFFHGDGDGAGLVPDGAYYLNLRDFTRRRVTPDEIKPTLEQACEALAQMKEGRIAQEPVHKSICEYCPAGAMCGRRA